MNVMPEILDDGSVKTESSYAVTKIGMPLEQRHKHGRMLSANGFIAGPIKKGEPISIGFQLRTSRVQSIYIHGLKDYDELLFPALGIFNDLKDLPKAEVLELPELKEGDMILATDNSFYYLTKG